MFGRTVGAVALAASALTAHAIFLPPGVTSSDGEADLTTFGLDNTFRGIKLPCPECVFNGKEEKVAENDGGDDMFWAQGGANSLFLNFTIEDDGHALRLNGHTLFPPSVNSEQATVSQVASLSSFVDIKESATPPSLRVTADTNFVSEESVSPAGDAVLHVTYQILAVERQPVSVEGAEVTMLKSASGELMMLNVEPVPKASSIFDSLPSAIGEGGDLPPPPPPPSSQDCGMLPAFVCELKNAVDGKMHAFKTGFPKKFGGCHGKKLPGHFKPHFDDADGRPHHHHGRPPKVHGGPGKFAGHHGPHPHGPHPHGPHGHPHGPHHRHHHGLGDFLGGLVMLLIPITFGITMGIFTGMVGMLVGRLIVFLWVKFARGGQRGYASVAQQEDEAENAMKDDGNMAEDLEPLPRYEEAPAYSEKEQE